MASFLEALFPVDVIYGGSETLDDDSEITRFGSGRRVVNSNWSESQTGGKYTTVGLRGTELESVIAFRRVVRGPGVGFRAKSFIDNTVTQALSLTLSATTFQIVKRYTFGGATEVRTITKPVADNLADTAADDGNSTVRVYNASLVEVTSGWTVDATTGILTFGSAPGYTPRVSCQFHIPVRLGEDTSEFHLPDFGIAELGFTLVPY